MSSVLVACLRCVHRWSIRSSSRVTFCASAVPVVIHVGLCCWHTVCSRRPFSGRASICLRSTGSSAYCLAVWRAAHCTVHRGQPPLRRHQPVSTLVEASGCCCRGSRLIYQQVSLSPPGGAPERSAPVQECELALLSRLTVLASMSAPPFNSRRVSSPRGVDQFLVPRKNPLRFFVFSFYLCTGFNLVLPALAIIFLDLSSFFGTFLLFI